MAKTVKVLSTSELIEANATAVRKKFNRSLTQNFLEDLDEAGVHVVSFSMLHNDAQVRARILCKVHDTMEPVVVWLDFDIAVFNSLRIHAVEEVPS